MMQKLSNLNSNKNMVVAHPEEKMAQAKEWADTLIRTIDTTQGFTEMLGNNKYLKLEAWQLIAAFAGLSISTSTESLIEEGKFVGYKAIARLVDIKTGEDRGASADMLCRMDAKVQTGQYDQDGKHSAVVSMAQTRAAGKVVRMNYAFVALLGGFQPLTAEEITDEMREKAQVGNTIVQEAQKQGTVITQQTPVTTPDSTVSNSSLNSNISIDDSEFPCPLHNSDMQIKATNNKTGANYWGHKTPDGKYCNANEWDAETPKPEFINAWQQGLLNQLGNDGELISKCTGQPIAVWLQTIEDILSNDADSNKCYVCGSNADIVNKDEDGIAIDAFCLEHVPS